MGSGHQEGADGYEEGLRANNCAAAVIVGIRRSVIPATPPPPLSLLTMSTQEIGTPARLGAGSFATVYVISGGLIAFKEVSHIDNAEEIRQEYDTLDNIYLQCNTDSFFVVPRAFAFFNPLTEDFATTAPSLPSANRFRTGRPLVTPDVMAYFQQPTYAMDRVHALPINVRRHLAGRYFPSQASDGPALCRLYFGRDYTGATPSRFVNTVNFPLDEARYSQMATLFHFLPPAVDVARAMGNMLSRLHHRASVDARDVEFVLGGDGGAGFTFFLIDFNQASAVINRFCVVLNSLRPRCDHGISAWKKSTSLFQPSSRTIRTTLALAYPNLSTITSGLPIWMIVKVAAKYSPSPSSMPSNRPKPVGTPRGLKRVDFPFSTSLRSLRWFV
jgi:hypothetical protein